MLFLIKKSFKIILGVIASIAITALATVVGIKCKQYKHKKLAGESSKCCFSLIEEFNYIYYDKYKKLQVIKFDDLSVTSRELINALNSSNLSETNESETNEGVNNPASILLRCGIHKFREVYAKENVIPAETLKDIFNTINNFYLETGCTDEQANENFAGICLTKGLTEEEIIIAGCNKKVVDHIITRRSICELLRKRPYRIRNHDSWLQVSIKGSC